MKAEILAIGSELLTPSRSETNAAFLTGKLREIGIDVTARHTVADDLELLTDVLKRALARADLVIATGGLGPTEDDLTREAAAQAMGRGLLRDETIVAALRERFAKYGRAMADVNLKQADVISGGRVLRNPRGTAPGQWVEHDGRMLVLLPGPPVEMVPMFETQVLPELKGRAGGAVLRTRVLCIASMSESDVEQALAPLYKTFANPRTTILGSPGQVELHLTAEGSSPEQAEVALEELASGMRERLPGRIFTENGEGLPEVVARLLLDRRLSLALAESCTGGLVAQRLTEVAGASGFLERAYVTYSNASKVALLGIDPGLIDAHGAVSEEVARAMAEGARRVATTDIGIGITGIAGPDGGSAEKPVGLVFIAIHGSAGDRVRRAHFPGDRLRVRYQASQAALEMLRRGLLGLSPL